MNSTKALSRTWETVTTYRECGVVVSVDRDSVTLSREGGTLSRSTAQAVKWPALTNC